MSYEGTELHNHTWQFACLIFKSFFILNLYDLFQDGETCMNTVYMSCNCRQ